MTEKISPFTHGLRTGAVTINKTAVAGARTGFSVFQEGGNRTVNFRGSAARQRGVTLITSLILWLS